MRGYLSWRDTYDRSQWCPVITVSPYFASSANNTVFRSSDTSPEKPSEEKEWCRVRGLIGINDHLAGVSHGSLGPKTVLEVKIEAAIASGDLKTAEELSDHMATREVG